MPLTRAADYAVQGLARGGLIVSHRGNTGGVELSGNRRSASMLDVVEAIEGPLHLNTCTGLDNACSRQSWCPAHLVWAEAEEAMTKVLRTATIDRLARSISPIEKPRWN
jgi:Rrf2 family protein